MNRPIGVHRCLALACCVVSASNLVAGAGPSDKLPNIVYILSDDLGESKDLASQHPDIVATIRDIMKSQHRPIPVFPLRPIGR